MSHLRSDLKNRQAIVSVVTVVKDHKIGLLETFKSLEQQTVENWEMIIVVGISTDESMSVSKNLRKFDRRVKVLKQEGSGIYRAMNQGLEYSSGKYIWFMNAGDKFLDFETLSKALYEIKAIPTGVLVGGYQIDSIDTVKTYNFQSKKLTLRSFAYTRRGGCHQAMLFQTDHLKQLGGYNVKYSLASDFDLVLRLIKRVGGRRVSEVFALVEPGGQADKGIFLVHSQKHQIRQENLGGITNLVVSTLWTLLARIKIKNCNKFRNFRSFYSNYLN